MPEDQRSRAVSRLAPNSQRARKQELQLMCADSRKHIERCVFCSSTTLSWSCPRHRLYLNSTCHVTNILLLVSALDVRRWTVRRFLFQSRTACMPCRAIRSINRGYGSPALPAASAKSSSSARMGFGFASMKYSLFSDVRRRSMRA